jgi:phytoene dehydrogenase-like protein
MLNETWREVCDIDSLNFLYHEEFARVESERGEVLRIFADVDRLESEFLTIAPEDAEQIRRFTSAIRHLTNMPFPNPGAVRKDRVWTMLQMLPKLPLLSRLSRVSAQTYGERFKHPLIRCFFGEGTSARMSVLALVFALAWQTVRNAGYPIGGSQAVIQQIVDKFTSLGGRLHCDRTVEKIIVENDAAVGLQLVGGERLLADWVISAADGHETVYELLEGRYSDASVHRVFETYETFPSYLQVSLGVTRELSGEPGFLTRVLDTPILVDPETSLNQVSYRIFHFDPTCAPPGKTAVTCFLPTSNFSYWTRLRQSDPDRYQAEKDRIAQAVIAILERRIPGVSSAIEVTDVSSPATVIRYTGNWRGSMEGWLPTPGTGFGGLPRTLPGLARFVRIGQWVQPGGGLPGGLMTARAGVRTICRRERVPFAA